MLFRSSAVVCDQESAKVLASSKKISYLSFIGSKDVGWELNQKVAQGTRVALEHGGVAPVIVEKDVDIDEVVPSLIKGGFYHAGQVCVSVQKVFVHVDICQEFAQKFAESASLLVVGDPLDLKTEVGPLISEKEILRVDFWVDEAIRSGAQLLCGGKRVGHSSRASLSMYPPSAVDRKSVV